MIYAMKAVPGIFYHRGLVIDLRYKGSTWIFYHTGQVNDLCYEGSTWNILS